MNQPANAAVLINTWNQAPWLEACIQSVIDQVPPPAEVVVHDDGSSDGTERVLLKWEGRVKVLRSSREANLPPGSRQALAIEKSMRATTSPLLFLLDGDDLFAPGKLAAFVDAFQRHPEAVMVQSPLGWIDAQGHPLERLLESFRHQKDPLAAARRTHCVDFFYPTSALAVTRTLLASVSPLVSPPRTRLFPDTLLALQAMLAGKVVTLDEEWGLRRLHSTSDSAIKQRSRLHLPRQTLHRTRAFNHYASKAGVPGICLWLNRRFYLQLAGMLLPDALRRRMKQYSRD